MKPNLFFLNDDAKLLDMMKRGEEEALTVIYRQNRKAIVTFVLRNSGAADDAEDVLQESVLILW